MRIDQQFLNWGVFLILLGGIPLAAQQNVIDRSALAHSWQLWPLIIVGIGVGLVLRRTSVEGLGGLIVAATFGVMLGGVIAVGGNFGALSGACGSTAASQGFATAQGPTNDPTNVDLEFNCGDLTVATQPGTGWAVSGTSTDGRQPNVDASNGRLSVRSRDQGFDVFGRNERDTWTVTLPQDQSISLSVHLNAGSSTIGLGSARLEDVQVETNAGSTTIDASGATVDRLQVHVNAGSAKVSLPRTATGGSISVNAGSVSFCVPQGVGLRLTSSETLSSDNFGDAGLVRTDSGWQSTDYASAEQRIDLSVSASLASLSLNPKDGCR